MARFTKPVDVHTLTPEQRAALQPGQHITASGAEGIWIGQTPAGTDVAAWRDNARAYPSGARAYRQALRAYAAGRQHPKEAGQ